VQGHQRWRNSCQRVVDTTGDLLRCPPATHSSLTEPVLIPRHLRRQGRFPATMPSTGWGPPEVAGSTPQYLGRASSVEFSVGREREGFKGGPTTRQLVGLQVVAELMR